MDTDNQNLTTQPVKKNFFIQKYLWLSDGYLRVNRKGFIINILFIFFIWYILRTYVLFLILWIDYNILDITQSFNNSFVILGLILNGLPLYLLSIQIIRRMNDCNINGKYVISIIIGAFIVARLFAMQDFDLRTLYVVGFLPFLGIILGIIALFPGTDGDNTYGKTEGT